MISGCINHEVVPPKDINYRSIKPSINKNVLIISAPKVTIFGIGTPDTTSSFISTPHKVNVNNDGKSYVEYSSQR